MYQPIQYDPLDRLAMRGATGLSGLPDSAPVPIDPSARLNDLSTLLGILASLALLLRN